MTEVRAYYNEFDPKAAAWLRELIAAGLIPFGDVDERSIEDVQPADLAGYVQCHFFAGIGGWPYALRLAGWPDWRPVWTASFPCQPFSAAGKQRGTDDERHLWPVGERLIRECRPPAVFGEQVASPLGLDWFGTVRADLEGAGYSVGAADLCAAGIGAPHIRQRLYWGARWLADAERRGCKGGGVTTAGSASGLTASDGGSGWLADADGGNPGAERLQRGGQHGRIAQDGGAVGGLEHAPCDGRLERRAEPSRGRSAGGCGDGRPSPLHGLWRDADWLGCRDGKWRPVERGTFPLAHGLSYRVGLLRGYGNAIVPPLAAEFICAFEEAGLTPPPAVTLLDLMMGAI